MSSYAESHFLALQDYIASGSKNELSAEQRAYEELLYATVGLVRKEGREAAIAWLRNDRGCSRHVAHRIYEESVNLFYAHDGIKDEAWRNVLFVKMMAAARRQGLKFDPVYLYLEPDDDGATQSIPRAKDYEAYAKLLVSAAKIRRLDQPDKEDQAPQSLTQQAVVVVTSNPRDGGLPPVNVQDILQNPYFRQIPKKTMRRLSMEAGLTPMDVDAILDTSQELADEAE